MAAGDWTWTRTRSSLFKCHDLAANRGLRRGWGGHRFSRFASHGSAGGGGCLGITGRFRTTAEPRDMYGLAGRQLGAQSRESCLPSVKKATRSSAAHARSSGVLCLPPEDTLLFCHGDLHATVAPYLLDVKALDLLSVTGLRNRGQGDASASSGVCSLAVLYIAINVVTDLLVRGMSMLSTSSDYTVPASLDRLWSSVALGDHTTRVPGLGDQIHV